MAFLCDVIEMKFKTIGILGGMGPEATLDLYRWVVKLTPAKKDQDHVPTIIYSYPQIPDRTQALIYGGGNPLPYLIKGLKLLEKSGADFIIIPCNTSHKFLPGMKKHCKIPIISMIEQTRKYIEKHFTKIKKVGLLATTGTVKTKVYHDVFEGSKFKLIIPDQNMQEKVMEAVYGKNGIKAGIINKRVTGLLVEASRHVENKGAEIIIMGCTEIPLALSQSDFHLPLVNPVEILARSAVGMALGKNKKLTG